MIKLSILLIAAFVIRNDAARILAVFPTPSVSHQVVFRPLILELVKRGHEVTMMTADPIFKKGQGLANLTEIDVHELSYGAYKDTVKHDKITQGKKSDLLGQMEAFFNLMEVVFEKQFLCEEMQSILKDKTREFDLFIFEAYFSPLLALTHLYKDVPVIQMSSFGANDVNLKTVGAPLHPLIFPTMFQQKINDLTFWDKLWELYTNYQLDKLVKNNEVNMNGVIKRVLGEGIPDIDQLKENVDMLFLNMHPMWEMNRPLPPNVIFTGGLHQKPPKELPKDLQNYLDSSKNGVIYVSFGTNVRPELLPQEKIQTLINVFSKLPYDVLWKWNQDTLSGQTENIKISKWLPQSDLLRHPKVKLFVTQGGLQSTDEAITAGVPLVGIPMLADQWFNVEQYVHHGIGLQVEMDGITEEKFENAVQTILEDENFRHNILKLRNLMHDQPQTPLERATWWTEYILRHGGARHLRSPAANMPWTEYYEVKFASILVLGLLSVISLLSLAVYSLYSLVSKLRVSIKVKSA